MDSYSAIPVGYCALRELNVVDLKLRNKRAV